MNNELIIAFKYSGGYGSIYGAYVVTLQDYRKIKFLQHRGEWLWFHGSMGKHSEVEVSVDNFYLVTKDVNEIMAFKSMFGNTFGSYEPLDKALEMYDEITYEEQEGEEY